MDTDQLMSNHQHDKNMNNDDHKITVKDKAKRRQYSYYSEEQYNQHCIMMHMHMSLLVTDSGLTSLVHWLLHALSFAFPSSSADVH